MFRKLRFVILIFLMTVTSATAIEVGGLQIPETFDSGQGELILNGTGIRKKFGFKIYVGGLYLKAKSSDSQKIINADEPMVITLTYKRNGPKDKITGVFAEGMKYAAGADYDAMKGNIDQFIAFTPNAKKKDVWVYKYLPGEGITFSINGELKGTITDPKFKKVLFAIWLLEGETFDGDERLRDGMLAK